MALVWWIMDDSPNLLPAKLSRYMATTLYTTNTPKSWKNNFINSYFVLYSKLSYHKSFPPCNNTLVHTDEANIKISLTRGKILYSLLLEHTGCYHRGVALLIIMVEQFYNPYFNLHKHTDIQTYGHTDRQTHRQVNTDIILHTNSTTVKLFLHKSWLDSNMWCLLITRWVHMITIAT